ncbi:MAG: penicillin-binding protein 2 [Candidatus Schekmanbacteria bacterium]|nr:penicillin-binding protein 2 [Candidatus Schekmanbacteria bacterium]
MYLSDENKTTRVFRTRTLVVGCCCLLGFFVLWLRFYYLQVIRGSELSQRARDNAIRVVRLPAPRGAILDRNEEILVTNQPAFSANIIIEKVSKAQLTTVSTAVSDLLGKPRDELAANVERQRRRSVSEPLLISAALTLPEVARLEAHFYRLPGVSVDVESQRYYPQAPTAAHILGYVGEIWKSELDQAGFHGYLPGDLVGRSGVELVMEKNLRGTDGREWIEVDAEGRRLRPVPAQEADPMEGEDVDGTPVPGHDLVLTLDLALQRRAEELLAGWKGAAVALDPNNGDILAMASSPTFDPNQLAGAVNPAYWLELTENDQKPLMNRAIQNTYPPGSVFKVVVAAAALSRGLVSAGDTVVCRGAAWLAGRPIHCWKNGGHGAMNLKSALINSCNVYFAHLGNTVGIEGLAATAKKFGLGTTTGIELRAEAKGVVPDPVWKKATKGEPWWPGETLNVAIGQGDLLVTPLQLASMIGAVALQGKRFQPHLVRRVKIPGEEQIIEPAPVLAAEVPMSPERYAALRAALLGVVNEHGTGTGARLDGILVAGKTGTVQIVRRDQWQKNDLQMLPQHRDHNWFVAFAPFDHPKLAVSVFLENGGKAGAKYKTYVARELFRQYLAPITAQSGAAQ